MKIKETSLLSYSSIPQNSFDVLRLLFAAIVVIGHGMHLSGVSDYLPFIPYFDTTVAVMGFFILSGYLILSSALKSKTLMDYYEKRARRLLPAYITIVVLCALLLSLMSDYDIYHYFTHSELWKYLGFNLAFLNFLQPDLPGVFQNNPLSTAVNGSLWTIKIEIAFYLSVPIIVFILKKLAKPAYVLAFLITLYFASILYLYIIDVLIDSHPQWAVLRHQFPAMLQYFSVGMIAYIFFKNTDFFKKPWIVGLGMVLFLEKYVFGTTFLWPVGLAILIFFVGFTFENIGKWLKGQDFSYGIYIIHYPIAQTMTALGAFYQSTFLVFLLYLIIVLIGSVLSWKYLELPFLKRKRHLIS